MAKAAETRRTKTDVSVAQDARIRTAMGKAVREVRRQAEAGKVKLVVADGKSWSVSKRGLSPSSSPGEKMAKATETRRTKTDLNVAQDARIRAAMGKAVREVRRQAETGKVKLVVADGKSWSVPKNSYVPK